MSQSIDTGSTGQSFWLAHHEISVNNCHIWKQFIVCDWPFCSCCSICDDSKWSYFRTCSGGSRDGNHHCFFTHLREGVNSLTDIHEVHSKVFKCTFRMFVHHPHNFCTVHSGTTTESDDNVRTKCFQLL